jgi:predicted DNA-binding transcriptional regulator AlpA
MRILTFEELGPLKGIPWTRDHVRRKCRDGEFPAPIQLSAARIGWIEAEVDRWLEERAQHRGSLPARHYTPPPKRKRGRRRGNRPMATSDV